MLLDTSGLLCFLHHDEPHHLEAVRWMTQTREMLLLHNYVLAELVALALIRRLSRSMVLPYIQELTTNPKVEIVWIDAILHQAAMSLLQQRQDKTYSLCDAVSFVLMRQRGLVNALTTDKHFEQEGFRRLLN
jgi:uncharacterized protein